MLKFFRKVRYDLMEKKNTSKYLKYAIGEIILVVIGILIALQINNWNENRKERIIEKELINDLITTVKSNQESLLSGLRRFEYTANALDVIMRAVDQRLPYADSLAGYFEEAHKKKGNILNSLNFSGYKSLENRGYHLIRNQELRKEVIQLFEQGLSGLSATNNQLDIDNSSFHYEYIAKNFKLGYNNDVPHNYEALINDPFYYSILQSIETSISRKINRVNRFLQKNKQVLELLESELRALN